MVKYTYEDIIIDPKSDRAKAALKKECYCGNSPRELLNEVYNPKVYIDILTELGDDCFIDDCGNDWSCIIVKKEEPKPECVPFESIEEFVERYTEVKEGVEFGTFEDNLLQCGMWLKSKDDDDLSQVTVIREYGICIDTISTIVLWKNLLDDFEFIDGTPCGKLVEESNA